MKEPVFGLRMRLLERIFDFPDDPRVGQFRRNVASRVTGVGAGACRSRKGKDFWREASLPSSAKQKQARARFPRFPQRYSECTYGGRESERHRPAKRSLGLAFPRTCRTPPSLYAPC